MYINVFIRIKCSSRLNTQEWMNMSAAFDIDQIFQHFIVLTSNQIKKAFNSEESEKILSSFIKRFDELFAKLKEKTDEI